MYSLYITVQGEYLSAVIGGEKKICCVSFCWMDPVNGLQTVALPSSAQVPVCCSCVLVVFRLTWMFLGMTGMTGSLYCLYCFSFSLVSQVGINKMNLFWSIYSISILVYSILFLSLWIRVVCVCLGPPATNFAPLFVHWRWWSWPPWESATWLLSLPVQAECWIVSKQT